MIKTYRDLIVWQHGINLVYLVYQATNSFPKEEVYGLVSQIRRSSISIPSNIAEGFGRNSKQDYIRFLNISIGSLYELQTQLEISLKLKYISQKDYLCLFEKSRELERMFSSLTKKLK